MAQGNNSNPFQNIADTVKETAGDVAEGTKEVVEEVAQGDLKGAAEEAGDTAQDVVSGGKDKADTKDSKAKTPSSNQSKDPVLMPDDSIQQNKAPENQEELEKVQDLRQEAEMDRVTPEVSEALEQREESLNTIEEIERQEQQIKKQSEGKKASEISQEYEEKAKQIGDKENFTQGDANKQSYFNNVSNYFEGKKGRFKVEETQEGLNIQRTGFETRDGEIITRRQAANRLEQKKDKVKETMSETDRFLKQRAAQLDSSSTEKPDPRPLESYKFLGQENDAVNKGIAYGKTFFSDSGATLLASTVPGGTTPKRVVERELDEQTKRYKDVNVAVRGLEGAFEGLQSPLGVLGASTVAGAYLSGGLTSLSSASPAAARAAGAGLLAAGAGQAAKTSAESLREYREGDTAQAGGKLINLGLSTAGFAAGGAAGAKKYGFKPGRTSVTENVNQVTRVKGTDTFAGRGRLKGKVNRYRNRPLRGTKTEELDVAADYLIQNTGQSGYAAGKINVKSGSGKTKTTDFFQSSRPALKKDGVTFSRTKLETPRSTKRGLTKTEKVDEATFDSIVNRYGKVSKSGKRQEFDVYSTLNDGTISTGKSTRIIYDSSGNTRSFSSSSTGTGTKTKRGSETGSSKTLNLEALGKTAAETAPGESQTALTSVELSTEDQGREESSTKTSEKASSTGNTGVALVSSSKVTALDQETREKGTVQKVETPETSQRKSTRTVPDVSTNTGQSSETKITPLQRNKTLQRKVQKPASFQGFEFGEDFKAVQASNTTFQRFNSQQAQANSQQVGKQFVGSGALGFEFDAIQSFNTVRDSDRNKPTGQTRTVAPGYISYTLAKAQGKDARIAYDIGDNLVYGAPTESEAEGTLETNFFKGVDTGDIF